MKIKIVPRWEHHLTEEGRETKLYDVYHGFTRFLFFTEWMLDQAGLDEKEMKDYLQPFIFGHSPLIVSKIEINL